MYYNIPTISTYDTMYEFTVRDFIDWNKGYPDVNWSFNINFTDIYAMTDVKYLIFENYSNDLENYLYWATPLALDNTSFYVMQVNDASFARTVNSLVTEDEFNNTFDENAYFHEISNYLANHYIVDNDTYDALKDYPLANSIIYVDPDYLDNNSFVLNIDVDDDCLLFIAVPNNAGWEYKLNSNVIDTYKIQGGFTAIKLQKGHNHIEANYNIPGINITSKVSIVTAIITLLMIIRRFKK